MTPQPRVQRVWLGNSSSPCCTLGWQPGRPTLFTYRETTRSAFCFESNLVTMVKKMKASSVPMNLSAIPPPFVDKAAIQAEYPRPWSFQLDVCYVTEIFTAYCFCHCRANAASATTWVAEPIVHAAPRVSTRMFAPQLVSTFGIAFFNLGFRCRTSVWTRILQLR